MAGSFFNGVMGSFAAHNQLGGMPAPGSSAGQFGGGQGAAGASGQTTSASPVTQAPQVQTPAPNTSIGSRASTGQTAQNYSADVVKSSEQSQTGNAARAYTPAPETPPPVSPDVRPVSSTPKES
jgi:hypothetical protein